MRLIDVPIGLFEYNGTVALKTEYGTEHNGIVTPDCYIVSSGEYFWGGAKSVETRNNLDVKPVDAVPVVRGKWILVRKQADGGLYKCSECGREFKFDSLNRHTNYPYCNCGAKIDLEQPSIEAAPVVRGHWIWKPEYCKWECSECGGREAECESPFCKWCGARMEARHEV